MKGKARFSLLPEKGTKALLRSMAIVAIMASQSNIKIYRAEAIGKDDQI